MAPTARLAAIAAYAIIAIRRVPPIIVAVAGLATCGTRRVDGHDADAMRARRRDSCETLLARIESPGGAAGDCYRTRFIDRERHRRVRRHASRPERHPVRLTSQTPVVTPGFPPLVSVVTGAYADMHAASVQPAQP